MEVCAHLKNRTDVMPNQNLSVYTILKKYVGKEISHSLNDLKHFGDQLMDISGTKSFPKLNYLFVLFWFDYMHCTYTVHVQ